MRWLDAVAGKVRQRAVAQPTLTLTPSPPRCLFALQAYNRVTYVKRVKQGLSFICGGAGMVSSACLRAVDRLWDLTPPRPPPTPHPPPDAL